MCIKNFAADESGAVTVDWTVMTAAIVGLGIATYGVVSGGVGNLSGDIDTRLRDQAIYTGFGVVQAFETFANGRAGWNASGTNFDDPDIDGGSGVFLLDQGMFLEKSFDLDPSKGYAVVEMEIQTIGLFDAAEKLTMLVNGESVDTSTLIAENPRSVGGTGGAQVAYTFVGTERSSAETKAIRLAQYADDPADRESSNLDRTNTYTMRMVIKDPGASVDVGMSGSGSIISSIPGEGVSINSVRVISTDTP